MGHRPIDLNLLRLFVAAAELRSMSAAARRLGSTQSAVSQGVRQLEEYLGLVLFDRTHRPMNLTPAALALLNRGRLLLAESEQIRSEVLAASRDIAPEVTIGLVDSFAGTCGAAFTESMLKRLVRLAIRSGLTPFHGEKLFTREFDLIIASDPFDGMERQNHRRVYTERFMVIAASGLSGRVMDRAGLQELARSTPMVRFNSKSHLGAQIETLLRRIGLHASSRLEVDTADMLVAMVKAGMGWAMTTPSCLLQGGAQSAQVEHARLHDIDAGRSIFVVGRAGEHELLFDAAFHCAQEAVRNALIPGLQTLCPDAVDLVVVG
jgi:DNA-binding transcriptional LysR family regulator